MKELKFNLVLQSIKPVIKVNEYVEALFDTGADIPVWTDTLDGFYKSYADAEYVADKVFISGFGGKCEGILFRVNFILKGLTYPHMPIFVPKEIQDFPYSLILPAAIFEGLSYVIDTKEKFLKVDIEQQYQTVRNLKVMDEDGIMIVLANN